MSAGVRSLVLALLLSGLHAAAEAASAGAQHGGEGNSAPANPSPSEREAPLEGIYARVIVDRTTLRSGPGAAFRALRTASRGDVFPIVERGTRGYWFRVELPDATTAWISGDAVYTHELSVEEAARGRFLPEIFAPAALLDASGELAFGFGVLGLQNGWMAVRPTLLLAPEFGFELTAAAAVGEGGRLLVGTIGGIVNVFPDSPVVLFVAGGGGMAVSHPNADTFLLRSGMTGAMYAGGGLRIGFRYRITLRVEARAWAFYDENRFVGPAELSGGLTVFF